MGVVMTTAIGEEVAAAPPHPLSSAEKTARYRARHPDRVVAQRKSPSGVRCQKEASKRYRDRHPEKRKKQWRDWAARNPTKRALVERTAVCEKVRCHTGTT